MIMGFMHIIFTRTVNIESGLGILSIHIAHAIQLGGQFSSSKLDTRFASVVQIIACDRVAQAMLTSFQLIS